MHCHNYCWPEIFPATPRRTRKCLVGGNFREQLIPKELLAASGFYFRGRAAEWDSMIPGRGFIIGPKRMTKLVPFCRLSQSPTAAEGSRPTGSSPRVPLLTSAVAPCPPQWRRTSSTKADRLLYKLHFCFSRALSASDRPSIILPDGKSRTHTD